MLAEPFPLAGASKPPVSNVAEGSNRPKAISDRLRRRPKIGSGRLGAMDEPLARTTSRRYGDIVS
jgi:hypothetical protein